MNDKILYPFIDRRQAGRTLARLLSEKNISQIQLAQNAKLKQAAISRALKTGAGISPDGWERIAKELDVPVSAIFGLD